MEHQIPKTLLWTVLVFLLTLLACGEQTPTPKGGDGDGTSYHASRGSRGSRNIGAQSSDTRA